MKTKIPRVGDWQYFHMTNLPNEPWFKYWLIAKDPQELTFSSVMTGRPQYQAEHFRIDVKDFLARKGKDITSSNMGLNQRTTGDRVIGKGYVCLCGASRGILPADLEAGEVKF